MRQFVAAISAAVMAAAASFAAQIDVRNEKGAVWVTIDGKPFTAFYHEGANKPYLHPLRTASGKVLTRVWPMEDAGNDKRDHEHHRGLWFSHGDVNGWDFWANEPTQKGVGKGIGKIVRAGTMKSIASGTEATVNASFDWVAGDGAKLLDEARTMRFGGDAALRWIDFDILLRTATDVRFGDTKEGTFAIRLRDEMTQPRGGLMLSATGAKREKRVWGSAAPWVDYSGKVEGEAVGVAIFDHPSNPRHPTRWHSRGYGLFAANIFGLHDFLKDKSKDGSLKLSQGETLRFRYRVLIHPGNAKSAGIATAYAAWAK